MDELEEVMSAAEIVAMPTFQVVAAPSPHPTAALHSWRTNVLASPPREPCQVYRQGKNVDTARGADKEKLKSLVQRALCA